MKRFDRYFVIFVLAVAVFSGSLAIIKNEKIDSNNQESVENHSKLESFYSYKSEYEAAFQKNQDNKKQKVIAGIVSHHFLAKDLIAKFFSGIDTTDIKNVYIIGPDHYEFISKNDPDLVTSSLAWDTPYGVFNSNSELIDSLKNQLNLGMDDVIFKDEHSIYTLVPFAKKVFPDAQIIPLVLKTSKDYKKIYDYGKQAYREDSVLIASIDFSHNETIQGAYEKDTKSIKSLVSSDITKIESIEADCKQCVAFLYGFLSHEENRFDLIENKTSVDFGSEDKANLTSYISAYYVPNDIRLLFGGDMMFDRYIRQMGNREGYDYLFQKLSGDLLDKDLVITNLEGPVTPYQSISLGSEIGSKNNYFFTFEEEAVKVFSNKNIRLVNIGNNHILNFGFDGLNHTKQFLLNNNVSFFGNTGSEDTIHLEEIRGKKLAFINYNQFVVNGLEKTVDNIKQLRSDNDFVFVYAHWGNEYSNISSKEQRELAHKFIDLGADAVIGSHPHVIQESEIYKDKKIYYSLGNMFFDQYFSEDTQRGLLLEVIINDDEISYYEHEVSLLSNGQTELNN